MPPIYVVVLITDNDGELNVNVIGASYDKSKAEGLANRQKKFAAPTQIIDIFEAEDIQ